MEVMTMDGNDHGGSLHERVYARLEEDILAGRYQDGESVTECQVAEELGVSRTPVREALRQLEREGLVAFTPNKGATVKGMTDEDIRDIGEMRTKIEGIAARRAASAISEAQLSQLETLLEEEERCTYKEESEALVRLDTQFHEIIFEACGSRFLRRTLQSFHHSIRQARRLSLGGGGRAEHMLKEHRSILEALRARNVEGAESLMVCHVRNATRNIRRMMQKEAR